MTAPDLGGSGVGNDASSLCSQLTLLEVCFAALSALLPPLHPTWCMGKAGELSVPKPSFLALLLSLPFSILVASPCPGSFRRGGAGSLSNAWHVTFSTGA